MGKKARSKIQRQIYDLRRIIEIDKKSKKHSEQDKCIIDNSDGFLYREIEF